MKKFDLNQKLPQNREIPLFCERLAEYRYSCFTYSNRINKIIMNRATLIVAAAAAVTTTIAIGYLYYSVSRSSLEDKTVRQDDDISATSTSSVPSETPSEEESSLSVQRTKTPEEIAQSMHLYQLFVKQLHSTAQQLLLYLDAKELCQLSFCNQDLCYSTLHCNHAWFRICKLYKIMAPNKKRNAARAGTTKAYELCRHLMTMKLRNGTTRPPFKKWIHNLIEHHGDTENPKNSASEFLKKICNGSYSGYNVFAWRGINCTPIWYRCRRVHPELGKRVRIVGLVSRPKLNGLCAVKVQWLDERNRWKVKVELDEVLKVFALKPENLTQIEQGEERVTTDRAGHRMKISTYQGGDLGYSQGWYCDKCASNGDAGSERWFCKQCKCDICFKCIPSMVVDGDDGEEEEDKGVQWKFEWDWSPVKPTGGSTSHSDLWISTEWMTVPMNASMSRSMQQYVGQAPALVNQSIIEFLHCVSPMVPFDSKKKQDSSDIVMMVQGYPIPVGVRIQATIASLTSKEIGLYRQQLLPVIIAQANRQGAVTAQAEDGSWSINGQSSENILTDDVIRQIMRDNGGDAVYFPA